MTSPNFSKGSELEEALLRHVSTGRLELTDKWVTKNESLKAWATAIFPGELENHKVLQPRQGKRPKHTVQICSVYGTEYEDVQDSERVAIYVGGPGSMVAAALDSVSTCRDNTTNNREGGGAGKVLYAAHSFEASNARSSAYYFHLRHSNALDADPNVRGPAILREFARRRLLVSKEQLVAEARGRLAFMKIDISLDGLRTGSRAHFVNSAGVLLLGFAHTVYNVALEEAGFPHLTDWVRNRAYSFYSIPVLRFLEREAKTLGVRSTRDGGSPRLLVGQEADGSPPLALHLLFDEASARLTEKENESLLDTNGITSRKLTRDELEAAMGGGGGKDTGTVHVAYAYPQDGRVTADMNLVLKGVVQAAGNAWEEGLAVEKVYVDEDKVRGVMFCSAATGKRWYQPCTSLVLSLGYTAQYELQNPILPGHQSTLAGRIRSLISWVQWKVGWRNPIGAITMAAGGSGYFLVRGKIPIIGTQNSHWTEVAYSAEADVTLAKLTGGGNIASEHIPVTYPLNNLEHIRQMFGDRFIDVLSVDSCPRSINPQNDVQFYWLASGLVVVAGLGGTGMTKCGANGALSLLLSHPHLQPSEVLPGSPDLFSTVDLSQFVCDCSRDVQRALGHCHDYSALEVCGALGMGMVAWLLWKKRSTRSTNCSECAQGQGSRLKGAHMEMSPPPQSHSSVIDPVSSLRKVKKGHLMHCHMVASRKYVPALQRIARVFLKH